MYFKVLVLVVFYTQVEAQVSTLPSPPSAYPTAISSVQQLVFCGQTNVPLTGVLATSPVAVVSPGYTANSAGEPNGFYVPGSAV